MLISTYQSQVILFCKCGNPNIIFRNRITFRAKVIFNVAVMPGSIGVASKNYAFQCKIVDVQNIGFAVR